MALVAAATAILAACTSDTTTAPGSDPERSIHLTENTAENVRSVREFTFDLIAAELDGESAIDMIDIETEFAVALAARWLTDDQPILFLAQQQNLALLLLVDQGLFDPHDLPVNGLALEAWLDNTMIGNDTADAFTGRIGGAFDRAIIRVNDTLQRLDTGGELSGS